MHIIAVILDLDQLFYHIIPVFFHTRPQGNDHVLIINGTSKTIDTGNRSHDHHIPALRKSSSGRMTQLVDLVVNRRVLFNVGISGRNIGFRLIIIVVGNKIFYSVFREKFLHFRIKLGCQCFIMGNDEGRTV